MAAGCAEIALALALLPVFCGRFQAVAHRNLYPSVIQWRHCCLIYEKAGSATAHPSPRKTVASSGKITAGCICKTVELIDNLAQYVSFL